MKLLQERCVSRLCVIGLVIFFGAPGCGDDEGESTGGVSEPDAGGDEASGRSGGGGRAGAGRGGRGASGSSSDSGAADGGGNQAGASRAGTGGGEGGAAGSNGAAGSSAEAGSGAGENENDAGSAGAGEAGSGGAGEAGGGGMGAAGSAGAGEAGSGGVGEAGGGGMGAAGSGAGGRCGTRGGVMCNNAQFCNFEPDDACGANDAGGVCEDKPEVCRDVYAPVCGCNNRTYGNECDAHANGVSSKRDGLCSPEECSEADGRPVYSDGASTPECMPGEESWSISGGIEPVICCLAEKPRGETCDGFANLQCDDGEFCNYEVAAGGQGCDGTIADAGGVCEQQPMSCTREYNPVCGCDHRTYGNACEAHANGESILHEDACNEIDCEAVDGRVVFGTGPAPMCDPDEEEYTTVIDSGGAIPIEGAICCVER